MKDHLVRDAVRCDSVHVRPDPRRVCLDLVCFMSKPAVEPFALAHHPAVGAFPRKGREQSDVHVFPLDRDLR